MTPLSAGVLGFILGMVFFGLCRLFLPRLRRHLYRIYFGFTNHQSLGIPFYLDDMITLVRNGYVAGFDPNIRASRWVMSHITSLSTSVRAVRKRPGFIPDLDVPLDAQVDPQDYKGQPWDRGHLTSHEDITYSRLSNRQTFLMSNILPQNKDLNRGAWKSLEHSVRIWADILGTLFVVTGAIFGNRPKFMNRKVGIPQFFFKVIYSELHFKGIAFIYPNRPLNAQRVWEEEYVISIMDLEQKILLLEDIRCSFLSRLNVNDQKLDEIKSECDPDFWIELLTQRVRKRKPTQSSIWKRIFLLTSLTL